MSDGIGHGMLFVAGALAAPLVPVAVEPSGIQVVAGAGASREWLRETACGTDACDAVRTLDWQGLDLSARIVRPLGAWARLEHVADRVEQAQYTGEGWALGGGLQGGVALNPMLAVEAWVGAQHVQTSSTNDAAERTLVEAGLTLAAGSTEDNFVGWFGVGGVPWSRDRQHVVDGSMTVALSPYVPVEAVAGVLVLSDPLGGRPTKRGRLIAGIDGSAGFRTSLRACLGGSF